MKTISKLYKRLALFSLAGSLFIPNFAAAAVPGHLTEDNVLVMSVPFDAPDEVQVTYTTGGGDFERTASLSETVSISISGLDLSSKDIPFDLFQTADGFALELGVQPEDSLSPILGFLSDLSTFSLDEESVVRFSSIVPGSTLEIFALSDEENPELAIEGEEPVPFVQEGVLRIKFKKQAENVEDTDEGDDEVVPEAGNSGGCSLGVTSVGTSSAWLALLPLAFALSMRKKLSH